MPHATELTRKFLEIIQHAVSAFVVIVLFFVLQHIFDMHFVCSCKEGLHLNGVLFLIIPPLILAFVVSIMEPFQKIRVSHSLSLFCRKGVKRSYYTYFWKWVVKYISLCAVWIAASLFDGDWYFCVMTNFDKSHTGMPCRNNLTYEEQRTKDKYMDESRDYGFLVICVFLLLWSIIEIRKACCVRQSFLPYYRVIYDELLAQEVSSHLNEKLKEIATKKAENICNSYLEDIKNHELPGNYENRRDNHDDNVRVSKVWEKISASGFYLVDNQDTAV